jgi:hypothetical protein
MEPVRPRRSIVVWARGGKREGRDWGGGLGRLGALMEMEIVRKVV